MMLVSIPILRSSLIGLSWPIFVFLASPTLAFEALNDTGIVRCSDNTNDDFPCPLAGFPGQDAEFGRDATHRNHKDGHAGFSFTKLDSKGKTLPANATNWACVLDNVTGLVWEAKTSDGGLLDMTNLYQWYNPDPRTNGGYSGMRCAWGTCDTFSYAQAVNKMILCGKKNWRLPTKSELLSIVTYDREHQNPSVDINYFPNMQTAIYWTGSPGSFNAQNAMVVIFDSGRTSQAQKMSRYPVCLVSSGKN